MKNQGMSLSGGLFLLLNEALSLAEREGPELVLRKWKCVKRTNWSHINAGAFSDILPYLFPLSLKYISSSSQKVFLCFKTHLSFFPLKPDYSIVIFSLNITTLDCITVSLMDCLAIAVLYMIWFFMSLPNYSSQGQKLSFVKLSLRVSESVFSYTHWTFLCIF